MLGCKIVINNSNRDTDITEKEFDFEKREVQKTHLFVKVLRETGVGDEVEDVLETPGAAVKRAELKILLEFDADAALLIVLLLITLLATF